jgi:hypothetical protein
MAIAYQRQLGINWNNGGLMTISKRTAEQTRRKPSHGDKKVLNSGLQGEKSASGNKSETLTQI